MLRGLLENADIAARERLPICQDTGYAVIFCELGQDVHLVGGSLQGAVDEGVRRAWTDGYLRPSIVVSPLDRQNTGDRMAQALAAGQLLPFDPAGQALYYMGPTPAPPGRPIGSCGPTTASRMDAYAPMLIERGLRLTIGKGARSQAVQDSMRQYGCVYLGGVEGMAALLSRHVTRAEVIAYPELGPEAMLRLHVVAFPQWS